MWSDGGANDLEDASKSTTASTKNGATGHSLATTLPSGIFTSNNLDGTTIAKVIRPNAMLELTLESDAALANEARAVYAMSSCCSLTTIAVSAGSSFSEYSRRTTKMIAWEYCRHLYSHWSIAQAAKCTVRPSGNEASTVNLNIAQGNPDYVSRRDAAYCYLSHPDETVAKDRRSLSQRRPHSNYVKSLTSR